MPARLEALGGNFTATRTGLHRVAEELVAPARKPQNEIALQPTPGGFGTPVFEFEGTDWQVRVDGGDLVVSQGGEERREPVSSLAAGAELIGAALFPDGPPADSADLEVDAAEGEKLGAWFALAAEVLEELRASSPEASEANLWPEHFDLAIEAGREAAGQRANYGFSPGDDDHAQPYLYVGPWNSEVTGEVWNAKGFTGAELDYDELAAADDPRATALEFCRARQAALKGE